MKSLKNYLRNNSIGHTCRPIIILSLALIVNLAADIGPTITVHCHNLIFTFGFDTNTKQKLFATFKNFEIPNSYYITLFKHSVCRLPSN